MSEKVKPDENSAERDIQLLGRADRAVAQTSKRMRRATLEFLWNKYVVHAK